MIVTFFVLIARILVAAHNDVQIIRMHFAYSFQISRDVVGHSQVVGIEVMQANETILGTTRERSTERVNVQCVDGTEVPLHAAEFVAIYGVEETRLELALRSTGRGDRMGILPTPEQYVWMCGGYHCSVHRAIRAVGFDYFEVVGIQQLRIEIPGSRYEQRLVPVEVQAIHSVGVRLTPQYLLASLHIILDYDARVKARQYVLVADGHPHAGRLVVVVHVDHVRRLMEGTIVILCIRWS